MPTALMDDLVEEFRRERGALFVGAGASVAAGFPDWKTLIQRYNDLLEPPLDVQGEFSVVDLLSIPQYYKNQEPDPAVAVTRKLKEFLKPLNPSPFNVQEALCRIPTNLIYTTNFDTLIESRFTTQGRPTKVLKSDKEVARYGERRDEICVRKLHGCISMEDTIVFTREDFATFLRDRPNTIDDLKVHLRTRSFLFIGYSLSDPDFTSIYDQILYQNHNFGRIKHYICLDSVSKHASADLKKRGLNPIELGSWGTSKSERLCNFLNELANRTTVRHRVERFFSTDTSERRLSGESKKRQIPIVVSSKIIDKEGCFSLPAVDTYTAQVIGRNLRSCNVEYEMIPADHVLQEKSRSIMQGDVVLVCGPGPGGNAVTDEFFKIVGSAPFGPKHFGVTVEFSHGERHDSLVGGDRVYTSSDLPETTQPFTRFAPKQEFGLVAKYFNPWITTGERGYVFLFAGIRGIGTHFLGSFLKQANSYPQLLDGLGAEVPFERIVRFTYDTYNPGAFMWSPDISPTIC